MKKFSSKEDSFQFFPLFFFSTSYYLKKQYLEVYTPFAQLC